MRLATTEPLFPWHKLPDSPDLVALRFLLDAFPDDALLTALRQWRGRGRNDFPVHVLWRVHLTRYFLRHVTMESCLAELRRNPSLRRVVGIEPDQAVPDAWNLSRFLDVLGMPRHLELMQRMGAQLVRNLGQAVGDLGRHVAGDSAALCARPDAAGHEEPGLPQPSGARKEYRDAAGQVTHTYEWMGYKFHLLVDVRHEVVVAWSITTATASDAGQIPVLLERAEAVLPAGRIETLAFDKAADDNETHRLLHEHGIKPLIENRALWKEPMEQLLPGHDGNSNVAYDEAGTIFCFDRVSDPPVKHKMGYMGYEKSRGTLKYRCPACHEGWPCPSQQRCNGDSDYGKTVRVPIAIDLRRFPPIPRATAEFEKRYNGRTAVERVNARLKLFWGADDGNVTGARRFHAQMATILLVHGAMACWLATQPRYEGKSLSPTRLSQVARQVQKAAAKR